MSAGSLLELQASPKNGKARSTQPMSLAAENMNQQPIPVGHGHAVLLAQLHLLVPVVEAGHTQ